MHLEYCTPLCTLHVYITHVLLYVHVVCMHVCMCIMYVHVLCRCVCLFVLHLRIVKRTYSFALYGGAVYCFIDQTLDQYLNDVLKH